ncbi:MAG: AraC family transcriptional regulator [Lachnospiraceae bacterium]|nr:AraC family transcriptional regulator [Lachnospiraceae bacterium]
MSKEYSDGNLYIDTKIRNPAFEMNYEHSHNYCEIYYLKSGSCTYCVNKMKYHLNSGDMFIVSTGEPHSTYYEGQTSCERIVIACSTKKLPAGFLNSFPEIRDTLNSTSKVVLGKSLKTRLEAIFEKMLRENSTPDNYSSDLMMLYTMEMLVMLMRGGIFVHENERESNEISADIEQAINYIALNYNQPLTLEETAARFNLCPSYFSRKFKSETGSTFKEYINYIRLRQAGQMLLTTDDSITKIAINCGYNSSNYFKDCFQKKYGMSPRSYRKTRTL